MGRITLRGLLARKMRLGLTALAIVLGVTFVTGTLVLGDTLDRTLKNVVDRAYHHVGFEIRGHAAFATNTPAAVEGTADRRRVPASIAASLRKLPGVADVFGAVGGYAQFVAPDGTAIGNGPGKAIGFGFDPDRELNPYRLISGRAPVTAHQVLMDKATAQKYHFKIGDSVRVLLPAGGQTFTISGLVTFGNDGNAAGETLAEFDQATAEQLFNARGYYSSISVLVRHGADNVELQHAIAELLPPGVQVLSGQALASQVTGAIGNAVSRLTTLLLIFALISLFVGAFTIFNTFTITVGQRTRELALLRLVGASRRQVFASVLSEAALTGVVGALIGLGLGVVAALGLKALLGAFGVILPPMPLVFEARTVIVALAVGIGVTVISAIIPARHAVSIPPVAALTEQSDQDACGTRRSRVIIGAAIAVVGIGGVSRGLAQPSAELVGIGAVAIFIATAMLAPLITRPLSGMLAGPLVKLAGTPARLGRDNSMRNPRRTAQTAGALMIGITLVSTIAVLGSSSSATTQNQIQAALTADYIITSSSAFSTSVPAIVSRLPQVTTTTELYTRQFAVQGTVSTLTAASPNRLSQTVNLQLTVGAAQQAMAAGQLLIDTTTANSDHLHVGSTVPVTFAETGTTAMRIGGIFAPNPTIGSYITGSTFFLAHYHDPLPNAVLVRTAPTTTTFAQTLKRALAAYPNLTIQSRSQYERAQASSAAAKLGVIYALLALAIVIALIGVVNTLMLSVFERTREIGLLRAVGMKRRQVRTMISTESIIIALLGAIIGIVMGTGLGIALIASLNQGDATISVPITTLFAFLGLAALLGAAAAIWPAQRAANLDVLAAIEAG